MMYLVIFVMHDFELVEELIDAWQAIGVNGATILHSSGMEGIKQRAMRDDLPLMPSIQSLLGSEEEFNRTIFSFVDNQEMVDKIVSATQEVVGDLTLPDTGVLVVLPILQAYGLNKTHSTSSPRKR